MMMRKKDGSLNLSIQAIVVLVMAMAVLGLGLGFIRGLIGQSQDKFEGAIANAKLQNPASADKPITVTENVKIKKGRTETFEVGIYNNGYVDPDDDGLVKLEVLNTNECESYDEADPSLNDVIAKESFVYSALDQKIIEGESAGFKIRITAGSDLDPETNYICTVKAGDLQKQFYINVNT